MRHDGLGQFYQKNAVIFREKEPADGIYIVLEGKVRLCKGVHGREVDVAGLSEGDVIGIKCLFLGATRATTAIAVTDVRLLRIRKDHFLRALNEDPTFTLRIMDNLADRISQLYGRLSAMHPGRPCPEPVSGGHEKIPEADRTEADPYTAALLTAEASGGGPRRR